MAGHAPHDAPQPAITAPDAWAPVRDGLAAFHSADPDIARAEALTHLPIFATGHRPVWWPDLEVRGAVAACHRQVTLDAALKLLRERFGEARAPSRSSVHRFWQRLDGPKPRKRRR